MRFTLWSDMVRDNNLLAVSDTPSGLLAGMLPTRQGMQWRVQLEVNGNPYDVAYLVFADKDSQYRIYGVVPRPCTGCACEVQNSESVAGARAAIEMVSNLLQKFYDEGRFDDCNDIPGLRMIED
jgi:hypothetical protein